MAGLEVGRGFEVDAEDLLATAAQQRQHAVRGDGRDRLDVLEVVAVLRAFGLLAGHHLGAQHALGLQPFAQLADQRGVLADALDQDGAGAVERGGGIGHALVRIDEGGGAFFRSDRRVGEDRVGQRFQTGLAGDLRLGAALGLVGQVEVFEARLAVGGQHVIEQRLRELPLLGDGREDRVAAVFHLAQVAELLLEVAQLGVVEAAGHFLAVAGDERHGRAFVQQFDRSADLRRLCIDLVGNPLGDGRRDRGGRTDGRGEAGGFRGGRSRSGHRDSGTAGTGVDCPPAPARRTGWRRRPGCASGSVGPAVRRWRGALLAGRRRTDSRVHHAVPLRGDRVPKGIHGTG